MISLASSVVVNVPATGSTPLMCRGRRTPEHSSLENDVREREVKLIVPDAVGVPSSASLMRGVDALWEADEITQDATYFDTPDLASRVWVRVSVTALTTAG